VLSLGMRSIAEHEAVAGGSLLGSPLPVLPTRCRTNSSAFQDSSRKPILFFLKYAIYIHV